MSSAIFRNQFYSVFVLSALFRSKEVGVYWLFEAALSKIGYAKRAQTFHYAIHLAHMQHIPIKLN